ncbi:MAG: acetyltransferase [Allomuricauda sp.]
MYIFGAGGHGKAVIDLVISDCNLPIEGLFDDNEHGMIMGIPIRNIQQIPSTEGKDFHIAIGDNQVRKEISSKITANFPTIIHPSSAISKFARVGKGTVVMAQCSIKAVTDIGRHCIINAGAVIGHDVTIGDYVHVAPNSTIAGFVTVGEGAHIGIGATIIQGVHIGKWSIIGAGAVIIDDVPEYSVVVGNPGRTIKMVDHHNITP